MRLHWRCFVFEITKLIQEEPYKTKTDRIIEQSRYRLSGSILFFFFFIFSHARFPLLLFFNVRFDCLSFCLSFLLSPFPSSDRSFDRFLTYLKTDSINMRHFMQHVTTSVEDNECVTLKLVYTKPHSSNFGTID